MERMDLVIDIVLLLFVVVLLGFCICGFFKSLYDDDGPTDDPPHHGWGKK